jgi:hypothetical protein
MTTDLKRLGKPGSYRLGQLRSQGIRELSPPVPFRPRFARSRRRGPASAWLLGLLAGVAAIAGSAAIGWWFMPFAAGLAAGLANRVGGWRVRIALPAVAAMGLAGWGIPMGWRLLHGLPSDAAAHTVLAQIGWRAAAGAGTTATLAVAVVQAVVGYWLGRAVTPRPADR